MFIRSSQPRFISHRILTKFVNEAFVNSESSKLMSLIVGNFAWSKGTTQPRSSVQVKAKKLAIKTFLYEYFNDCFLLLWCRKFYHMCHFKIDWSLLQIRWYFFPKRGRFTVIDILPPSIFAQVSTLPTFFLNRLLSNE